MTTTYKVVGMTCGGCVKSLTTALQGAMPSAGVSVILEGGLVRVEGEHESKTVERAVEGAGFDFAGHAS